MPRTAPPESGSSLQRQEPAAGESNDAKAIRIDGRFSTKGFESFEHRFQLAVQRHAARTSLRPGDITDFGKATTDAFEVAADGVSQSAVVVQDGSERPRAARATTIRSIGQAPRRWARRTLVRTLPDSKHSHRFRTPLTEQDTRSPSAWHVGRRAHREVLLASSWSPILGMTDRRFSPRIFPFPRRIGTLIHGHPRYKCRRLSYHWLAGGQCGGLRLTRVRGGRFNGDGGGYAGARRPTWGTAEIATDSWLILVPIGRSRLMRCPGSNEPSQRGDLAC